LNRFYKNIFISLCGLSFFLSLWFGFNSGNNSFHSELNRTPAQNFFQADPFRFSYFNPRPDGKEDFSTCDQASDCKSSLCLRNKCVPRFFSTVKGNPGQSCNDRSQCFSDTCDMGAMKCVGSPTNVCAYVEQFCNDDTQCCSGTCNHNNHRCEGDSVKECGTVGATCGDASECCSAICATDPEAPAGTRNPVSNRCMGSNLNPAISGQVCNSNDQCLSNDCHSHRCQ
jgi:hypothetical protein